MQLGDSQREEVHGVICWGNCGTWYAQLLFAVCRCFMLPALPCWPTLKLKRSSDISGDPSVYEVSLSGPGWLKHGPSGHWTPPNFPLTLPRDKSWGSRDGTESSWHVIQGWYFQDLVPILMLPGSPTTSHVVSINSGVAQKYPCHLRYS